MDTIKEMLADFKERLSNPLISSFAIAWIICNWPITIALLFYKREDIVAEGFKSYYGLIKSYSDLVNMLVVPLLVALVYTFLFPHLKAYIKLVHAKIVTNNDKKILNVTSKGVMPISKYLEQTKEQEKLIDELGKLVKNQGQTEELNTTLVEAISQLNKTIETLNEEKTTLIDRQERLQSHGVLGVLDGKWEFSVSSELSDTTSVWEFQKDMVFVTVKDEVYQYILTLFSSNPIEGTVMFKMGELGENGKPMLESNYILKANENYDVLRGEAHLNDGNKMFMKRLN